MSSTADMEGPGGSFECVQQQGSGGGGALAGLGALPHKLRIHANDDVYEATRHRMTVAEENHKNKCTRVIKPNQTDIGRKVKVKQAPGRAIPPPRPKPAATPPPPPPPTHQPKPPPIISSSNGLGSNHVTSSRPQNNKPSSRDRDSDIMRRPIKERLIHLLALRPYKKPELVERINRDGREKNVFTTVLKQIAYMRDNVYHLHQHIWNDVHDDWPYYTEQERQLLKRRKPQNLTPPGSSDGGSSGSGQSPTSTHPGSPPPPVTSSVKRPGYYDGADGLPTKKPRISHYRKPEPRPVENPQRRPITDSRDASNMNPRSRESQPVTTVNTAPVPVQRHYSDDEADPIITTPAPTPTPTPTPTPPPTANNNRKRAACDNSHSLSYNVSREKTFKENSICSSPIKAADTPTKEPLKERGERERERTERERDRGERERERDRDRDRERERERERDKERTRWNKVSSTTHNGNSVTRVSPDSQADRILTADPGPPPKIESKSEFPDYLTEYTTIKNVEQRRRYKADFNADYAEYRDLHAVVERVSRRFAQLEERLKQEEDTSQAYKDIRKQIVRDYRENQRDVEYQKAKRRFQYLHDKLSHIKRLVLEYDAGSQAPRY